MPFGFGARKSKSSSSSNSLSTSLSGDMSRAFSGSLSEGASSTQQRVAFEDIFAQLYGGATGAANQALLEAPELSGTARQLFTGGVGMLEGLGQDAGTQYLEGRLGDEGFADQQIDLLREDTGRLFSEELNPAITSRAVAGGTLGGGRQGVAQGLAMEGANREFQRGALDIRMQDQQRKDDIAASIAANSLAATNTGLGALPGLLDTFQQGQGTQLGVYSSLSSILGGPTVLSQSQAAERATSASQSMSDAFSQAFATSTSKAKGKSASVDLSGGIVG
jgi:hypothetical protein